MGEGCTPLPPQWSHEMPHSTSVAICSAAALGLAALGLSSVQTSTAPDVSIVQTAYSLGFTPEACALAGLSVPDTAAALARLSAADSLCDNFAAATAELDDAMAVYAAANDAVKRGLVSPDRLAARTTAQTRLNEAREDLQDAKDLLNALLSAECTDQHLERFANCSASAGHNVPLEYRVLGYTDEAWEEVAAAVRQRRRVDAGVLDAEAANLDAIAALDTNADVIEARERLADNLGAIQQAFSGFEDGA